MKIIEIYYNWFQCGDIESGMDEDWDCYIVGSTAGVKGDLKSTIEIIEHLPKGEGDRLWYDIMFNDGTMERIFNPNKVIMSNE